MRKRGTSPALLLLSLLTLLAACTEVIDVRSKSYLQDCLAVEATLTNRADRPQRIILSRSFSYFKDQPKPMVKGASVKVDDVVFSEAEDGIYVAPEGYCCAPQHTYHLTIDLPDGSSYTAEATMPEEGFRLDAVDYAYVGGMEMGMDSIWSLGIWGYDKEAYSTYFMTYSVNGLYCPLVMSTIAGDLFFNDNEVSGYPIMYLQQTATYRRQFGDCFKYLERGDVICLEIWTLDQGYFEFLTAQSSGAISIPLFTPQPANLPTNIEGRKAAAGYFAICPVVDATVVVDDPLRPYFNLKM